MAGMEFSPEYLQQIGYGAFSGTTGPSSTAGALTAGMSIFNAANTGFSIWVYSIRFFGGAGAALHSLTWGTTNLALGTNATISSNILGSGNTSVAIVTFKNTATAITGTNLDAFAQGNGLQFNQAPGLQGDGYLLPAGVASSLNLFVVAGGAGPLSMTFKWREFQPSI